jgi:hypothetical protein
VKGLTGLCLLGAGCFYLDPLNKAPNVQLGCELTDRPCQTLTEVHRGDRIGLRMVVSDPDGNEDPSSYSWAAFACDSTRGSLCPGDPYDAQSYDEHLASGLEVEVPVTLPGHVHSISVDFEARDNRGGVTTQSMIFPLTDAPTLPSNAAGASTAPGAGTMYVRSR